MTKRQDNRLWIVLGVVIVLGVTSFFLFYLNRHTVVPASWGNDAGVRNGLADWLNTFQQTLLAPVVTAVLGILIVRRHPGHQIGRLLLMMSVVNPVLMLAGEWAVYGYFTTTAEVPGQALAAWVTNWIWVVLFGILLYMAAVFPTGRFLSRRWGWVLTGMLLWFMVPFLAGSFIEREMSSAFGIANPLQLSYPPRLYNILFAFALPAMPVIAVTTVASVVIRFRRGHGRERHQLKWLLAGVALMALMVVSGLALSFGAGIVLGDILVNASILGPILGVGVALLRHKLYDVDIIIHRTLVYAVVSALLGLVYFGLVVVLQSLVTVVGGQQSSIAIVISTLTIAVLFSPVQRQVQTMVDRRFYRQKYDAARTLSEFAATARDETDLATLMEAIKCALGETVQPKHISVWLKQETKSVQRSH